MKITNTVMRDKLLAIFTTKQTKQRKQRVYKLPEPIAVKHYELRDGGFVGSKIDRRV